MPAPTHPFTEPPLTWATLRQCEEMRVSPTTAAWNRAWIRHQLQLLDLSGSILLDLGSGAASPFSFWYASRVQHAFLIDLYHPPKKFQKSTSLVHDLEQPLPLPDESTDLVVSSCTFQFLSPAGRRLQMAEIQRVLRPGGFAFLTMAWLHPLTDHALATLMLEPVLTTQHIHMHSAPNLADMLRASPKLQFDGDADPSHFPGYSDFSPARTLADPALLVMRFTQHDPARFRPETTALDLRRLGIGMRLKKSAGPGGAESAVIQRHARAVSRPISHNPGENAPPLLVHVHLPKNAGSSFNDLLASSFSERFISKYPADPNEELDEAQLVEWIRSIPSAVAIASHSFTKFPPHIADRHPLYVTFLRNPLERHRSYYRFAKKNFSSFTPEHRNLLPPEFHDMTCEDFTAFIADLAEERLMRTQSQLLCGRDDAQAAIDVLSGFFFVGIVEQMDESVELLRNKLRDTDLKLDDRFVPRINVTAEVENHAPIDPSEARLLTHLQPDLQLHEWARKNLDARK